jgi:hypothetical protein
MLALVLLNHLQENGIARIAEQINLAIMIVAVIRAQAAIVRMKNR